MRIYIWLAGGISLLAAGHASLARPQPAPPVVAPAPEPQPAADVPDGRARLHARLTAFVDQKGRAEFVAPTAAEAAPERPVPAVARPRSGLRGESHADHIPPAAPASARALDRELSARELGCLTEAVYYEARSESDDGQAAVAEVILNRAASPQYPADVCAVVYQRNARTCQFSYTCDGSIGRFAVQPAAWARAGRIARDVATGERRRILPDRSVNYHADYVAPGWGRRLERVHRIGAHIFYGAPLHGGSTPGAGSAPVPAPAGLEFRPLEALQRAYALAAAEAEVS